MLSKSRRLPIQDFFGAKTPRPLHILRNQYFAIKIYHSSQKYPRFGVVVSKKLTDKASARVKIKRLVFNFIRVYHKTLLIFDYLIIPSSSITKLDSSAIQNSLSSLLSTLNPKP